MSVTVSEVEASRPDDVIAAADRLRGKVGDLDTAIGEQRRQLEIMRRHWQGAGADAAIAKGEQELARQQHLRARLHLMAETLQRGGTRLGRIRTALLAVVEPLRRTGWRISDDGVATPPWFAPLPVRALAPAHTALIKKLLGLFASADEATADAMRAAWGLPPTVVIPGAPADPPTDPGHGEHGSQSPGIGDRVAEQAIAAAAEAADVAGWDHAAEHLRHYLDNSGEDLELDVDTFLDQVPGAQQRTDELVNQEVARIVADAERSGNYGQPIPFQTGWQDGTVNKDANADWYYAVGSYEQSASGVVVVHPPSSPGAKPRVSVEYRTHVFDRYNWDGGKSVEILGQTITDDQMGRLHTVGLAQEYDIRGTSQTYRYEGAAPGPGGPVPLPPAQPTPRGLQRPA
ncbi:WXG100 family type VII secretion target [Mycobacterium sp. SMC-4]|uniref:WXG100 family type VII secretion target n=1 Tax=Mycobacterium sp. SMC-4 TaxID=2857059 RepID=UPI003CFE6248